MTKTTVATSNARSPSSIQQQHMLRIMHALVLVLVLTTSSFLVSIRIGSFDDYLSSISPSVMDDVDGRSTAAGKDSSMTRRLAEIVSNNMNRSQPHPSGKSAAVCLLVKNAEPYLDEWVDYYLGIGFSGIYIMDNSDEHNMKGWKPSSPLEKHQVVKVHHWKGAAVQRGAYGECAKKVKESTNKFTWVSFYDIDEFLVMRKHNHVVDLLEEHCPSGSLSINWIMMGSSNETFFRPLPVTKRFVYRAKDTNRHVKTVVKLDDLDLSINFQKEQKFQIHNFKLIHGTTQKDTNGRNFTGPWLEDGPTDVASIYHFFTKSKSEFNNKACQLGQPNGKKSHCGKNPSTGSVFDDSVWVQMKKHVPKYAMFDHLYP